MEEVSYLSLSDKYVFHHFARKRLFPTQDATLVRFFFTCPSQAYVKDYLELESYIYKYPIWAALYTGIR